jgi:hypothetical protein
MSLYFQTNLTETSAMSVVRQTTFLATLAVCFTSIADAAWAAPDPANPDWPCVQGKVENLSPTAIWDGPPIDQIKDWRKDTEIDALVRKLATRKIPIERAKAAIEDFAKAQPDDMRDQRLTTLFAGLFEVVNTQRRVVIKGIEKYQRAQKARAEEIEKMGKELAAKGSDPEAMNQPLDATTIDAMTPEQEKYMWANRIFKERQDNIPIACELPPLVEERLFDLTRTIRGLMKK